MKFDLINGLYQARNIVSHSVEISAVTQGFNVQIRLTCTLDGVRFANQIIVLASEILADNVANFLNERFDDMCHSLKRDVDSHNGSNIQ